jgi:hypothetical protein
MFTIESVVVHLSKQQIEFDLSGYDVRVIGSRMLETGYELVLEGEESEIAELLCEEWQYDCVILGE